jgi:hypothetical protein
MVTGTHLLWKKEIYWLQIYTGMFVKSCLIRGAILGTFKLKLKFSYRVEGMS